jgi:hypothetical protein
MTTTATPAVLSPSAQLTGSVATYITGAPNGQTIIKNAVISNTTTLAATVTIYRVPTGGSPLATNVVVYQRSVGALPGTYLAPELINMTLNPGDTIQCVAGTASAPNFTASGFFTTP